MVLKSCSWSNDIIVTRMIIISSVGHCMPYWWIIFLTKACGNTSMAYGWFVEVYFTEHDHFWSTLLSRIALMGYGYMCLSDLRLPWWLASNSLCFSAGLSEFLIRWWKISGCSQVLVKSKCESRWDWPL